VASSRARVHTQRRRIRVDSLTEIDAPGQLMAMQPQRTRSSAPMGGVSFVDVFERELDFVWNCLRRLGIPEQDLEDEALEVFLRVKDALDEFDATRSIRPWMAGFAYRVACEYRRRRHRRFERVEPDVDTQEPSPSPEQHAASCEERAMVLAALDRVDVHRRAVLVLHDIYGYTIPEVAENCEIPLNTAYSRLRLARAEFAQALKRLGWRDEP
jgi:RNA polymerase sigma-70 factor (ECF subfamily)